MIPTFEQFIQHQDDLEMIFDEIATAFDQFPKELRDVYLNLVTEIRNLPEMKEHDHPSLVPWEILENFISMIRMDKPDKFLNIYNKIYKVSENYDGASALRAECYMIYYLGTLGISVVGLYREFLETCSELEISHPKIGRFAQKLDSRSDGYREEDDLLDLF